MRPEERTSEMHQPTIRTLITAAMSGSAWFQPVSQTARPATSTPTEESVSESMCTKAPRRLMS